MGLSIDWLVDTHIPSGHSGDQTANNCLRRSRGGVIEWADGNMTWTTTLHGASRSFTSRLAQIRVLSDQHGLTASAQPKQERGQHQFFNWTVTQALFKTSVMVVGYHFPIWSKMMSFDFQWNANENYETQLYASRLFHEPRKHCLRNSNSYQLPTTISHLLISNKCHQNSPTMKSASVSTKNVTPGRKNLSTCDSWGWCARWTFAHGQNGLPEINRVLL